MMLVSTDIVVTCRLVNKCRIIHYLKMILYVPYWGKLRRQWTGGIVIYGNMHVVVLNTTHSIAGCSAKRWEATFYHNANSPWVFISIKY